MDKDKEEFQHDWYAILGLEVGSAKEAIEKAARKLAILYHPDKTTDVDAPAKFLLIQKAKEILTDDDRKRIIDEHYAQSRKRKEYEERRGRGMDEQRKRFKDQLDSRINKEAQRKTADPNDVLREELKKKTKVMENMRKQNSDFMEQAAEREKERQRQKESDFLAYRRKVAEDNALKLKQVKFKWKKSAESHSEDSLYFLLKQFGSVEDVAIVKGNCALVTFATAEGAQDCIAHYAEQEDFRVTLLHEDKPKAKVFTHAYTTSSGLNEQLAKEIERVREREETRRTTSVHAQEAESADGEEWEGLRDSSGNIIFEKFLEKEAKILGMLQERIRSTSTS
eukprot:gene39809-48471_t